MRGALALAVAMAWPGLSLGQDAKVLVQAEVVLGTEPVAKSLSEPLKVMQAALAKKKRYGTLSVLVTRQLTLEKKPTQLGLPNEKTAELSLESLKDGVATVRVKVPPADTTSTLGREGSLYLHAGKHQTGDLWLVLSHPKQ